ncbi:MAG: metallothionein [Actinomycetota bacterium]|jgi:hypothetical protein|nr:metallothionein [Actinomycetota bacterium]
MANYAAGTVLTCSHGECGCRVRIESECDCPHADMPYVCRCGEAMVKVADDDAEVAGSSAG